MKSNQNRVYNASTSKETIDEAEHLANVEMCQFRRKLLVLHQAANSETCERTMRDLKENLLQEMHTNLSGQYLDYRGQNIKKILSQRKHKSQVVNVGELNMEGDTELEPACHGLYESCEEWEIKNDDLNDFSKCINFIESTDNAQNKCTDLVKSNLSTLKYSLNNPSSRDQPIQQQQPETSLKENNVPFFRTAREELFMQQSKQTSPSQRASAALFNNGAAKKSLGGRRTVNSGFVPPVRPSSPKPAETETITVPTVENERLLNIDPKMIELIENEIMHKFKPIAWEDIAGLEYAKSIIKEAVVYPILRPDIFTGLRRPPRGILLFGPPGTGKTLIGKCIASQSNATFFSISASSLTSKWIGESEKMVRALFAVAAVKQPSVVFIDEIDSLLSQRSDSEHESSRRLKTEFLVQLDGAATSDDDRIVIVGATNRPQELDEAARRRLVRRLYIPLPEQGARMIMLTDLLNKVTHSLDCNDIDKLSELTEGYSGADIKSLCHESSMEPIRSIPSAKMVSFKASDVRPISMQDFITALERVRPSVSQLDLKQYTDWNEIYGASR